MRKFLLIFLFLLTGISCNRTKVYVGIVLPLSGRNATYGKQVLNGIELAFDELKGKTPLNIELIKLDNLSRTDETRDAIERLAEDRSVVAVIGPVTSEKALVAASIASKLKISLITPTATNTMVTKIGEYVFRVCYTDPSQGKLLARFAYGFLGLKRASILYEINNPYSEGLARSFENTFEELGGDVLSSQFYITGEASLEQKIDSLLSMKPEILFIPGYVGDVLKILEAIKGKTQHPVILGGDGWHSPELIEKAGGFFIDGLSAYISTHFSPAETSPETKEFVSKYQEKYGVEPEAPSALGYDAFNLIVNVLSKLKSIDREEFRQTLLNMDSYWGATGLIKFQGNHDPVRDIFITRVTPYGFKFIMKGRVED